MRGQSIFLREVQPGVLAKELEGLAVVGPGRLDLDIEPAHVPVVALVADVHHPFLLVPVPAHALVPRASALGPAVPGILAHRADPQVAPAVVQPIAIDVVHDHPFRRVHEEPVQGDVPTVVAAAGIRPVAGA